MSTYNASKQENDEKFMRRCIQLARNGMAGAAPNPMVGAVIVHEGRIIGEGYHRHCGGPHAEVNAIRSVRQPELLATSTIYVSLEPCSHWGKTPPCADLIIEKRIPRVVIGCQDPFAKVNGLGIKKLRDAGCNVTVGVLEQECLELNRHFITFHTRKRPYITLKWAQSRDGFIGGLISTPLTQKLVHRLRALSSAILVGGRTALADNPSLTTRLWTGNNPLRIVVDTHGDLPRSLHLFDDEAETLVWHDWDLEALMKELHGRGIQTLIVEGGAATHQRFIEAGLYDEVRVEMGSTPGEGTRAPQLPTDVTLVSTECFGENEVRRYLHSS